MRTPFFVVGTALLAGALYLAISHGLTAFWWVATVLGGLLLIGAHDVTQRR